MNSVRAYFAIAVLAAVVSLATQVIATKMRKDPAQSNVENVVRDYLAQHPDETLRALKNYLIKNPDVLTQTIDDIIRSGPIAAIKKNENLLFSSPRQVTLGNPKGDVTLVEFFDYNCGYCRRALTDLLTLMKDDPNLKIVLKEFPILGPESIEVARVAVALRMQDPSGQKYLAFHQKLLGERGVANKDSALAAAKSADVDMERLEKDMAGGEPNQTFAENAKLAQALKIDGTPAYIIGDAIVSGAVGADDLKTKIQTARDRSAK